MAWRQGPRFVATYNVEESLVPQSPRGHAAPQQTRCSPRGNSRITLRAPPRVSPRVTISPRGNKQVTLMSTAAPERAAKMIYCKDRGNTTKSRHPVFEPLPVAQSGALVALLGETPRALLHNCVNRVYARREGAPLVNGFDSFALQASDEEREGGEMQGAVFMWRAGNDWLVGLSHVLGKRCGFLRARDAHAVHPDMVERGAWEVWAGTFWLKAPELECIGDVVCAPAPAVTRDSRMQNSSTDVASSTPIPGSCTGSPTTVTLTSIEKVGRQQRQYGRA